MRHQPNQPMHRGGTSLLGGLLAVILVVTMLPAAADARQRVTPINGTEGVPSVTEGRAEGGSSGAATSGFAHLNGTAQHSSTRGLRLAGVHVNVTSRTSVFPNVDGMSSGVRARQLSGRALTVFGEMTPNGVEAVLIIVQPSGNESRFSSAFDAPEDQNFEPSATDPRVGHAPNNVKE